jgi:zinc ribbon protein
MFCPKCAAQNIEGAHFCRACGANLSLIAQALSGQLPTAPVEDSRRGRRRRGSRPPRLDEGVRTLVMGFGFIAVAIALAIWGGPIGASVWWFWMLIPAFAMLGKGIAEIVRANQLKLSPQIQQQQISYVAPAQSFPATNTNELPSPVASVTEGTTRHLGTEAATRQFDPWDSQKPS